MQFLSDVFIRCPECSGKRYREHILEVRVKLPRVEVGSKAHSGGLTSFSIADLLEATIEETIALLGGFSDSRAAGRAQRSVRSLDAIVHMNIFSTDHPMVSQPSCFDAKAYPWRSFFCNVVVLALIFTPLLYGCAVYSAVSDDVQCTDDPRLQMFFGSWAIFGSSVCVTFAFCFVCAVLTVSVYRLLAWYFRKSLLKAHGTQATRELIIRHAQQTRG